MAVAMIVRGHDDEGLAAATDVLATLIRHPGKFGRVSGAVEVVLRELNWVRARLAQEETMTLDLAQEVDRLRDESA